MYEWHKKVAPLLGLQGSGGGLGFLAGRGGGRYAEWYDNLDPFNDGSQVGYWKMEGPTPQNEHTGTNVTTLYGTPSYSNIGDSQYYNNPETSTLSVGPRPYEAYPISFSIWCYKPTGDWTSGDANQLLVNWTMNSSQRLSICCVDWTGNGQWEWGIMYGGTNHWTFAPSSRPENQWMHMVYSLTGNNDAGHRLYQNGGSALSATNQGGGHGGSAGAMIGGNATSSEDWNGWIYNVRLFNKALSQSEANQLFVNDKPFGA